MSAISPVAHKIAKLLPRLATDHDGEVVAVVRAIRRMLRKAGLDLHDLAGALEREPETKVVVVYRDPHPGEPKTWADLARWCRDHDGDRLKPHERKFVRDMSDRLVCNGQPTERQGAWLRTLYARLRTGAGQ